MFDQNVIKILKQLSFLLTSKQPLHFWSIKTNTNQLWTDDVDFGGWGGVLLENIYVTRYNMNRDQILYSHLTVTISSAVEQMI